MQIENAHERLSSLWGLIDQQHNQLIASRVVGKSVLDVGCGYGSLVCYLQTQGFQAEGVDSDPAVVAKAKLLFPEIRVKLGMAENLRHYLAQSFDTIVLKDSLHHLVGEGDVEASFQEFRRLLRTRGRVVILDPNPTWLVKLARRAIAHSDPVCSEAQAVKILESSGFAVTGLTYFEVIGLPLSGGYVGLRLVPNKPSLNQALARANQEFSERLGSSRYGRLLCWRYIVDAEMVGDL